MSTSEPNGGDKKNEFSWFLLEVIHGLNKEPELYTKAFHSKVHVMMVLRCLQPQLW